MEEVEEDEEEEEKKRMEWEEGKREGLPLRQWCHGSHYCCCCLLPPSQCRLCCCCRSCGCECGLLPPVH
jgi:hypothetical protein